MKKLRSNSKEVREAIKLHLIEISQNDDVKVETVDQAVKYIGDRFIIEVLKHNNIVKNIQDAFIYWLNGLALNTYYYTDDIINYLHSIGLYGKNEKQERANASDLYHYLIFKEVKKHIMNSITLYVLSDKIIIKH